MAHSLMAKFVVMLDEGNDTSCAVALANALSESIDRLWLERTETERTEIATVFGDICDAIEHMHDRTFLVDNVIRPQS